jgi:mono/diheme cytochrome c family protein
LSVSATAGEPELNVQTHASKHVWPRSMLLAAPEVVNLTVDKDPTYPNRVMHYKAVPLVALFKPLLTDEERAKLIEEGATVEFTCLDGFSAQLDAKLVFNTDPAKAQAYVAIELPTEPWPTLKKTGGEVKVGADAKPPTAGPFYLVWRDPQKSQVTQEQWPYQVVAFTVRPGVEQQFPALIPLSKNAQVIAGYSLFVKNCFACHQLNGEGHSHLGPDLNIPLSPTEYLRPGMLRKLIRNPQNLRRWPESKMSAFSAEMLSDRDIDAITEYLKYMASHRPPKEATF